MQKGLSTNRLCSASAVCLAAGGVSFVVRYYCERTSMPEKRLRPCEARQLAAAGIDLAVVYQVRARQESDFGAARGEQDGRAALEDAARIGQPPGSAIYFAVDVDFSKSQITRLVIPYFAGVRKVFDRDLVGYTIGVYGSGLTCRLLLLASAGVKYAWLAEATGWRESAGYSGWHIKQFVNHSELCALGDQWEACESKADFGQFRPIGSTPLPVADSERVVDSLSLTLLSRPHSEARAIAILAQGTPLEVLGDAGNGWVRVRWTLPADDAIGYVRGGNLGRHNADTRRLPELEPLQLPQAHLAHGNLSSARSSVSARVYPLGEPALPFRGPAVLADEKRRALAHLADWMDVESSARYRPHGPTSCNVYVADYCYLARAYLPRIWWNDRALAAFARGERPPVLYDQTVSEMRADGLYGWLLIYGPQFGWRQMVDLSRIQSVVNEGGVGIICAEPLAEGSSGHITLVVPEQDGHAARRASDGSVLQPLQSQAGLRNRRYGSSGPNWWLGFQFRSFVMFVHD